MTMPNTEHGTASNQFEKKIESDLVRTVTKLKVDGNELARASWRFHHLFFMIELFLVFYSGFLVLTTRL